MNPNNKDVEKNGHYNNGYSGAVVIKPSNKGDDIDIKYKGKEVDKSNGKKGKDEDDKAKKKNDNKVEMVSMKHLVSDHVKLE